MFPDYNSIAQSIIALKDADLKLRDRLIDTGQLWDGYNPEMEQLHINNANALNTIIDLIGYPTTDKVGKEASDAAWLVIQHAISLPGFMKRCAVVLKEAVAENKASFINLAYLKDRIAVFEGNPQQYGTQFDWDEDGKMSPSPFDDLHKVNERRKAAGLNLLEEQTAIMRARAESEKAPTPKDLAHRKQQTDAWRKKVGWI